MREGFRVAAMLACAALISCQTRPAEVPVPAWSAGASPAPQVGPRGLSMYLRGGGYIGASELERGSGPELDGYAAGGRLEIGGILDPRFELGARVSVGDKEVDVTSSGTSVEVSGLDVYFEPVLRAYLTTSRTRPYLEGFAGYAISDIDASAAALGYIQDEDADGFTYGGGAGVEFNFPSNGFLAIGIEGRWMDLDGDLPADLDRFDVLGTLMFGTRW